MVGVAAVGAVVRLLHGAVVGAGHTAHLVAVAVDAGNPDGGVLKLDVLLYSFYFQRHNVKFFNTVVRRIGAAAPEAFLNQNSIAETGSAATTGAISYAG